MGSSLVWGAIAIGLGMSSVDVTPINAILALIGVYLVTEGIWILVAPAPGAFIAEGLGMLMVGLWNVLITLMSLALPGQNTSGFFFVIGIFQIGWACKSFGQYGRFSDLPREKPSAPVTQWLDETIKETAQAVPGAGDTIEFKGKGHWKARLFADAGLFVMNKGQDIVLAGKRDISFVPREAAMEGRPVAGTFTLPGRALDAKMPTASYRRFIAWQSVRAVAAAH
jgi:hypothetical protein